MHGTCGRLAVLAVALAVAAPASAASRISLGAVQNDRGSRILSQLESALCESYACVPRRQVVTDGKVDFAKMKAHKVSGFLFGSVTKKGGSSELWLALVRTSKHPSRTWTFSLTPSGALDPSALDALRADLAELLGAPAVEAAPAAAPAAGAPPRISMGAIGGPGAGPVTRELTSALCSRYECVPRSQVTKRGKVSFAAMQLHSVSGFLFGSVTKKGASSELWLALLTESPQPTRTWKLPLGKSGTLSEAALAEVTDGVDQELKRPEAAPEAAKPVPPAAEAAGAAAAAEAAAPPPPPPAPEPVAPPPPAPEPAKAEAPPPPKKAAEALPKQYVLAVDLGAFFTSRDLAYTNLASSATILGYQATIIAGPYVGLEFFPLAFATDGLAAGLGIVADYGISIGLKSTLPPPDTSQTVASTLSMLRAGLEWRIRPFSDYEFAFTPVVAYEAQKFTTSSPPPGLPDTNLSGVEVALDLEFPVGSVFTILAGGGYVKWLQTGDLVGPSYFPSGSAYAIEADAGLDVRIWGPLSIRGLAVYSATQYSFSGSPTATGAQDRYLGGRATLRGEF